ncbi:MAG: hypothetical protein PHF56_13430 [Desulfuromonadaceae bacterium]|nr:hypothetical protein [Desulfuromonadaceae bacterium]
MRIVNTFDKHLQEPEKTVGAYIKKKKLELGVSLLGFKKIYLDTKYWLMIRDAKLDRSKNEKQCQLLEMTEKLAASGEYIFPISEDVFAEILKQTDPVTLMTTVDLIDKFSKGVSLISSDERVCLEIFHFLESQLGSSVHSLQELAWTKVAYILGFVTPENENIPSETNLLIQKASFDQLWSITLGEMIDTMCKNGAFSISFTPSGAEKLNIGKFEHENENHTFDQMFQSELGGMVDLYKTEFKELMAYMFERNTGSPPDPNELENSQSGQLIANMIYNLFKHKKIVDQLPSFRIYSGLHAAVRWDKKQKFQANDLHDFRHAVAALPYCDFFFTEKRLSHLITQNMLKYDDLYDCVTLWNLDDVVSCVGKLCR